MSERPTYVWRLHVELPTEMTPAMQKYLDENPLDDYGCPPGWFPWPRHDRRVLSEATANKRAELLRSYGATVRVEKSLPVQWETSDE